MRLEDSLNDHSDKRVRSHSRYHSRIQSVR
jgi:hypothetical protein